jgi:hydroxypyruvate reductase
LDRPAPHQLTAAVARLRADAGAIAAAGTAAVLPHHLHSRVLRAVTARAAFAGPLDVIAVGKAAAGMFDAFAAGPPHAIRRALVVAPTAPPSWPWSATVVMAGHPLATSESERAARLALDIAASVPADGCLVCLLSGGASALMAAPRSGIALAAKQQAVSHVMKGGADIRALNAVRKHLSLVKGGRLAAACAGVTVTAALSDVIGDDLSVIGSGPAVPDPSTWLDAAEAVARHGGWDGLEPTVAAAIRSGVGGALEETPKPGDAAMARASAQVVAGRADAMDGARAAAAALGYRPIVLDAAVVGEAREAAVAWWDRALEATRGVAAPFALVTSGETTVRVRGGGRGGRNQEFALALVDRLAADGRPMALASVGTDGIDGPTDAAGALVDATTAARARAAGHDAGRALVANDSYPYLEGIGDLVRTGPSGTNVGDLQVLLVGRP